MIKKQLTIFFGLLLFLIALPALSKSTWFNSGAYLYPGSPTYAKLSPSIKSNKIFVKAPSPHISVLNYQATETSSKKIYSSYQITLLNTKHKLTQYRTIENADTSKRFDVIPIPVVKGRGVGYGGIFSIAFMKWQPNGNFYRKYAWSSISDVSGKLFPLRVGNQIKFHYNDMNTYTKRTNNRADDAKSGEIVYQVIDHFKNYKGVKAVVPGDIYVIRFSKSTRNGRLEPQNDYYFSTKLGWYVYANYYRNGKVIAEYRIVNWKA